jgi:hypothetical protein
MLREFVKHNAVRTLALVVALAATGCDSAPAPMDAKPTREEMFATMDALSASISAGRVVSDAEFQADLDAFAPAELRTWSDDDLRTATSSVLRVSAALVKRYGIESMACTDDSWLVYDECGAGYLCAMAAGLSEARCLWSATAAARK